MTSRNDTTASGRDRGDRRSERRPLGSLARISEAEGEVMDTDQVDRKVVTTEPATAAGQETTRTESRHISTTSPGRPELTRRILVLVFGLVQIVIGLRFVLLLLDAREANALVSGILNFSQLFVAPFEGILRTDALRASGSILDVTAIVAFVGWTILEVIVLWAVGIFRRTPA
jgi:hypothetical protein